MTCTDRRQFVATVGALALSACASAPRPSAVWRQLTTEPYHGKQDDIFFMSRDVGWYGNGAGKLYRTQDGGESWTKICERPGTFIRALGFVDASNGFLGNVGTDYYPGVTDEHPLYRTRDSGVTWAPVEAPGIEIVKGICGIDILPRRTIYQGAVHGLPIIHAAGRVGGPATMLRSTDGGETWRVIDLRSHAGMILDVKFFDANVGFVCAASSTDIEQANALILRTTDGGMTWTQVYRSARTAENCWKMNWPSRSVGYATVQNYQEGLTSRVIVKTEDGGASWRELALVDDARAQEFGVGFVDETWGWVGTAGTGFETRDGGRTWSPIEIGRAVNKIRIVRDGVRFRAFAIGAQIYRLDG